MEVVIIILLILCSLGVLLEALITSLMGFSQDFRKEVYKTIDPDEIICSQSRSILYSDIIFFIIGMLALILTIKSC